MKTKICPKCKVEKSVNDFHKYFSKERQKYRVGNYCKPCSNKDSNIRAKKHYQENREQKIKYAAEYFEKNYDRQLFLQRKAKARRRKNLELIYIRHLMTQKKKFRMTDLHQNPDLVELYKNRLLFERTLKKIRNGKK